ncbi:MAG TPA: AAA family ATPase, partial [Niastella sp.]
NEYVVDISFYEEEGEVSAWSWDLDGKKEKSERWQGMLNYFDNEWSKKVASKMIYFPANLNFEIDADPNVNFNNDDIIDFSKKNVSAVWNLLLETIQKYQEQELQIRQEISKTVEQSSNDLITIKKALEKLEEWKRTEFNPIADVAENCLDSLLANFKVRVKRELDIKKREDIGFIKIEDFSKNEIPHHLWSTGTKQVVLSALPLYLLKPKNTIILFDEPERSLYPDLQRLIINYYNSLTDKCQFFYSTHSPIIASAFEPWEIVELKFNKEGYIYRELYYEGENHVNNYKLNPKTMRWDDILQRIFDLENDGSEERKKKLDELATCNVKYQKLKKAGKEDTTQAKELLSQIEKLRIELSKWD